MEVFLAQKIGWFNNHMNESEPVILLALDRIHAEWPGLNKENSEDTERRRKDSVDSEVIWERA